MAGCGTTYSLEIYSTKKDTWETFVASTSGHDYFISNWDASTGVVTISNGGSDGASGTLKPTTSYQMRISMTSTYSTTTKKTAYDEFTLTLQETCLNNKLKLDNTQTYKSGGANIGD